MTVVDVVEWERVERLHHLATLKNRRSDRGREEISGQQCDHVMPFFAKLLGQRRHPRQSSRLAAFDRLGRVDIVHLENREGRFRARAGAVMGVERGADE